MRLHRFQRTTAITATAVALSFSLAACGGDEAVSGSEAAAETSPESSPENSPESSPESSTESTENMDSDETSPMAGEGAAAQTFGEGCAQVPTSGAGSFDGMVKDPVATAASNNPLLTTLVTAVGAVDGLADTLNSQEALTVFAPYNGAFAEIPRKDLNALVKGGMKQGQKSALFGILAHHVLPTNAGPEAVVGDQKTLAGDTLTIEGDAESGMTVSDGTVTANVLCGNIPTANATVYVVDKVLTGVK